MKGRLTISRTSVLDLLIVTAAIEETPNVRAVELRTIATSSGIYFYATFEGDMNELKRTVPALNDTPTETLLESLKRKEQR